MLMRMLELEIGDAVWVNVTRMMCVAADESVGWSVRCSYLDTAAARCDEQTDRQTMHTTRQYSEMCRTAMCLKGLHVPVPATISRSKIVFLYTLQRTLNHESCIVPSRNFVA